MPKRNSEQAPAIDLDQLPPWFEGLEPAVQEQVGKGIWSPSRVRNLAEVYARWGAQLLKCARVMECELDQRDPDLEHGPWLASDPIDN